MDENELPYQWGSAENSEPPHVWLEHEGVKLFTLPYNRVNEIKMAEVAAILNF